jgi:hypothetical protein
LLGSFVVLAAGELVVLGAGVAFVFGDAEAIGLGLGDGDFLVAAVTAPGAKQARATMQAVMVCNLFFMVGI